MKNLNLKEETLAKECEDYSNLWNDSSSWVTASGTKVNNQQTTYKDKLQKLVDFHIADTLAHDVKAHGRWKPTANMTIKALDETADSAFLTFTETCYRGQTGIAEERMIDAFYSKQTKKFKILFFINKKLIIRKAGAGFNNMMEELCFFFRSPKFGTPERQDLMEWVDKNGNKITTSSKATTAKQHPLNWPYTNRFEKIIEYHMKHTPGTKVLKKDIAKYVFQYEELQKNGVVIDIIAGIDDKEDYLIKVFQDRTNIIDTLQGIGYENFLTDLKKYMVLPTNKRDPEYQNLLVESVLTEFVDKNGTKIDLNNVSTAPINKSATSKSTSAASGDVYAWSVYVRGSTTYTKGGWLSAEYFNGQLEGAVFSTPELAEDYAWDHLKELENEGELYDEDEEVELDAEYFTIETIAYPKADMNANVDLIEFIDNSGQKVVLNSNSAAPKAPKAKTSNTNPVSSTTSTTPAPQPPVVAKNVMKRKPAKDKFGLSVPNWQPEFIKLGLEIWHTTKKPADEKDSGAGPTILRIYFEMPNGEEWRLEVTNTKYALAKGLGIKVDEDWDYVISTDRNGGEIIIQRGKTKDYNEFLDILLGLGIISNKKKCV